MNPAHPRLVVLRGISRMMGWLLGLSLLLPCRASLVDPTFDCVLGGDGGEVLTAVRQVDGSLYVGGQFTSVAGARRAGIARLLPNGSVDPGFRPGAIDGSVIAIAIQEDGRVVIGGSFTRVAGFRRNGIARLLVTGAIDTSFDPGDGAVLSTTVPGSVSAAWIQADGRIVVGGNFRQMGGQPRALAARLNANGSLDTTFDPGTWVTASSQSVLSLAPLSDGRVYVGGRFAVAADSATRRNLARLNTNGSVDLTFDPQGAADSVNRVLAEADGGVTAAGYRFIRRFRVDGSRDSNFSEPDFARSQSAELHALAPAPDGYWIGGDFSALRTDVNLNAVTAGNQRFVAVGVAGTILVSSDGTAWGETDGGTKVNLEGIAHGNGRFVAVGPQGTVRVSTDGTTWLPQDTFEPYLLHAVQYAQDQFLAVGSAIDGSGVALTSADGVAWTPRFAPVKTDLLAVACASNRLWVAVGKGGTILTSLEGVTWSPVTSNTTNTLYAVNWMDGAGAGSLVAVGANGTILYSTDGTNWLTRTLGSRDTLRCISTGLGRWTIGGDWGSLRSTVNTTNWFLLGSPTLLNLNATAATLDRIVMVGDGGTILTATSPQAWSQVRNQATNAMNIARLDRGGQHVPDFSSTIGKFAGIILSTAPQRVRAITTTTADRIFVAGGWLTVDNTASPDLAQLRLDGTRDPEFQVGTGIGGATTPSVVLPRPDGRILIAGDFISVNGQFINRLARLNGDGSVDPTFYSNCDPKYLGCGADRAIHCLAVQADGRIVLGGIFNMIHGQSRRAVVRLLPDGDLDPSFNHPSSSPAYNSTISAIAVQRDGRVVINGSSQRLMRLETNGVPDPTFNIGAGALGGSVNTIVMLEDESLWVGGSFTNIAGMAANRLARLFPSGSPDTNFVAKIGTALGTASGQYVDLIAPHWDQNLHRTMVVVGGQFTNFNGTTRNRLLRLELDGTLDPGFDVAAGPNQSGLVHVGYFANQTFSYFGGSFTTFAGFPRNRLVRWIHGVGLDTSYNIGAGPNGRIVALSFDNTGNLLLGGEFTAVEDEPWPNIVRIKPTGGQTPLSQWIFDHFTAEEAADPRISGNLADPDGDGLVNLIEFAFGLDPHHPDASGIPSAVTEPNVTDGKMYLVLAYHRRVGDAGVQYGVELSDDLVGWEPAGARLEPLSITPDPGGITETVRYRVLPSVEAMLRGFTRVVVTPP